MTKKKQIKMNEDIKFSNFGVSKILPKQVQFQTFNIINIEVYGIKI